MSMKNLAQWAALLLALAAPAAGAIQFDEVPDYGEVFVLAADAPARNRIELRWAIEDGYYLYNNRFLRFAAADERVVVGQPVLPRGEIGFDELLGEEVEKFRHELPVTLPLIDVPPGLASVELRIRSQGCLEDVLCYPPTEQVVTVALPAADPTPDPDLDPLGQAFPGLPTAAAPGIDLLGEAEAPALAPEEAFVYEAIALDADTALVRFTAQPGYYLYVDQFRFGVEGAPGVAVRAAELPAGVIKDDPEFG
ncbi:MAG: protein-disulfide reductase DsbD N-terminal domain-containing protein, partial [Xanthomonadales bacterium]|nr:protein-disulfide reductase DsbD N-terminal domain-containing protein [Xanthomonadales bacterium]